MTDWTEHLKLAKTKQACIEQGNRWSNGECEKVSVEDFCRAGLEYFYENNPQEIRDIEFQRIGLKEYVDKKVKGYHDCYEKLHLPEYKKNQVLSYFNYDSLNPFLMYQKQQLSTYQIDRAIDLIAESGDETHHYYLAEKLFTYHSLTEEQIKKSIAKGLNIRELYQKQQLQKELLDFAIKHKVFDGIDNQDLSIEQKKKVIDLGKQTYENYKFFKEPEIVEYAVKKGVTENYLYANSTLNQKAIDTFLDDFPIKKYQDLFDSFEGGEEDEEIDEEQKTVKYMIDNRIEDAKELKNARYRYDNLDRIYEYQKLSPEQVKRAIDLGYHIETIFSYQKLPKGVLVDLISKLDYKTIKGKSLFNTLWANKDLPRDMRQELAKKAGIEELMSDKRHFVWNFIHPNEIIKVSQKLNKAISEKIQDNPIATLVGKYNVDIR